MAFFELVQYSTSKEEPLKLHFLGSIGGQKTSDDVMSEGPSKCEQSPCVVVNVYLSVSIRSAS